MLTTETHKLLLKATNSSRLKKLASGILFKKKKKSGVTSHKQLTFTYWGEKVVSFKMVRSLCARVQVCLPGPVLIFKSSPIDLVFVNE